MLDLDYESGLGYILLDLYWKSCGQRFIITLIIYFTGVGFENTGTTDLEYNYLTGFNRIWTLKYLDDGLGFRLLFTLLDLNLKILGLRIWIKIIRFYWI